MKTWPFVLSWTIVMFLIWSFCSGFSIFWGTRTLFDRRSFPSTVIYGKKYDHLSKSKDLPSLDCLKEKAKEASNNFYSKEVRPTGTTLPVVSDPISSNSSKLNNTQYVKSFAPSTVDLGFCEIGHICSSHGLKGYVKCIMNSDFAKFRLESQKMLYIRRPNRCAPRPVRIDHFQSLGANIFAIHFHGISTKLLADCLRGYQIFGKSIDRPPLLDDDYCSLDLIGLSCCVVMNEGKHQHQHQHQHQHNSGNSSYISSSLRCIGQIRGVVTPDLLTTSMELQQKMHSLLEIEKSDGQLFLLPFVKDIVWHVDLQAKHILITPPAGLLDRCYEEPQRVRIRGYLPPSTTCKE